MLFCVEGNKMIEYPARAYLSVQRALVGEITPNMRLISVEASAAEIHIWVYYDGPITEEETEDFDASVGTQVVADFPYVERGEPRVLCHFVRHDVPQRLMQVQAGRAVYGRRELGAA